jgi:Zn-dependent metalloprotease
MKTNIEKNYLQITCKLLANYLQITCLLLTFSFGALAQATKGEAKADLLSLGTFDRTYTPAEATALLHKVLPTDRFTSFVPYKTENDQLGYTHTAFQQYYKGIKVQHGEYVVHSKNGQIAYINGRYKNLVGATLAEPLALAVCKQKMTEQLSKQTTDTHTHPQLPKEDHKEDHATAAEKAELVWWGLDTEQNMPEKFRLAYFFEVHDLHAVVYADAYTGELLHQSSVICSFVGDATTRYRGTQRINTRQTSPGRFELIAGDDKDFKIISVETANAKNTMIDNDGQWTESSYAANGNDVALDAHWGGMQAQNYWESVHGRNGYNGQGTKLKIIARAGNDDNAYWDQLTETAIFHDGNAIYKPLVSLDLVGHEVGHGFNFSFGLKYSGEAVSLHEGFADIWGVCLAGSWQFGSQIMKNGKTCMRDLANPENSTAHNKGESTYKGTDWNIIDEHGKGLVLGHWFYLLSQGGTGRNDFGNSFTVNGISLSKAEKIAYRMGVAGYLTSGATYKDIPQAARRAAADLYGECSPEVASVVSALYAVGLTDSPLVGYTQFFAWQNFVCKTNVQYNFSARVWADRHFIKLPLLDNSSFRWELSNGLATGLNGQWRSSTITDNYRVVVDFMPPTMSSILDGYWETLTAIPLNCTQAQPASYRFWVGRPAPIGALSQDYLCMKYANYVSIEEVDGATGYEWYVDPADGYIRETYGRAAYIIPLRQSTVRSPIQVYVRATNNCSLSTDIDKKQVTYRFEKFDLYTVNDCKTDPECPKKGLCREKVELPTTEIVGYPNPAQHSYTLSWQGTANKIPYEFAIYNSIGTKLLQGNQPTGENHTIDVSQWADGLYMVQIQSRNQTQYIKFLVQKGSVAN